MENNNTLNRTKNVEFSEGNSVIETCSKQSQTQVTNIVPPERPKELKKK